MEATPTSQPQAGVGHGLRVVHTTFKTIHASVCISSRLYVDAEGCLPNTSQSLGDNVPMGNCGHIVTRLNMECVHIASLVFGTILTIQG